MVERIRDVFRPPWTAQMTTEELDTNEKRAFLEWRRNLARLVHFSALFLEVPLFKNYIIPLHAGPPWSNVIEYIS